MIPHITGEELRALLPMTTAIDALDDYLRSGPVDESPLRSTHPALGGSLLIMPAWGRGYAGVKLVTINPANSDRGVPLIAGTYVLFDENLAPVVILDGAVLTEIRTAAVSGVATRHLAKADAKKLMVFGTGVQARAHVESMRAVRPIRRILVAGLHREAERKFVEEVREQGIEADSAAADRVGEADIVCTCTTATEPLFDGDLLAPGCHVNGVGSHQPATRELDDHAIRRSRIVVETRAAALSEAGDLLIPIETQVIDESQIVAELQDVARGATVRTDPADITVFKSVGVAFEDLCLAAAAFELL